MDGVDGTDRQEGKQDGPTPSLLFIILDTNPHAWALLQNTLPFSKAIANILVFINAHLAVNNANQVAVIASHSQRSVWLYPRPPSDPQHGDDSDTGMDDENKTDTSNLSDASKYRPFALIENSLLHSLRKLIKTTTEADIKATTSTQMAGALTMALSYINKATIAFLDTGAAAKPTPTALDSSDKAVGLQSRILVVSVSGDLAYQYIPIMNSTFAAQRLRVPMDILKLAGDTVFLQQAAFTTRAVYLQLKNLQGVLQYLMMAFLPDQLARKHLVVPTQEVVDFRAACFCHRSVVDVGFVCSICLSIFCTPPEGAICLTCETQLALGDYGNKPAVIPKKKKKKKRALDGGSSRATPAPEAA
ncbi:TFIIH subunit Tfb4/p34 [Calycina marina]|uniref:General transcription and DNA repair factor IIH subunit TFB4 n=1 Tax=Calycina marina TaxID=1763456 RepID=A0A9P7Z4P4_9HELO|nr:TFIIH subunit Tfb4/p34 [Calycina marina]